MALVPSISDHIEEITVAGSIPLQQEESKDTEVELTKTREGKSELRQTQGETSEKAENRDARPKRKQRPIAKRVSKARLEISPRGPLSDEFKGERSENQENNRSGIEYSKHDEGRDQISGNLQDKNEDLVSAKVRNIIFFCEMFVCSNYLHFSDDYVAPAYHGLIYT